jgi:ubiquinone/menaquinone biosynthesis C-methylase UbiE
VTFLDRFRRRPLPTHVPKTDVSTIRAFFNRAAQDEEHYPSTIDPRIFHVKLVLDHLGDLTGKRIADVGCGKGRFAKIVAERASHQPANQPPNQPKTSVIAIDIAEAMLAYVASGESGLIQCCAASMTELPLATGSCGGAYATESLEHAVDIPLAVAELCRIVEPGGRIVIIDKNAEAWGRIKTPEWERWFGRKELERLLARHCREVSSREISYWEDVEPDGLFLAWLAVK